MKQVAEVRDKLHEKALQTLKRQLNPNRKNTVIKPACTPADQPYTVLDPVMDGRIDNVERDIHRLSERIDEMQETMLQTMCEKFAKLTLMLEN